MDTDIVVLILTAQGHPWDILEAGIRATWYKKADGIDIIFYYGSSEITYFEGDRLFLHCDDGYSCIGQKTIMAFEQVLERYPSIKYVFRTNQSSYVRLDKLKEVASNFVGNRVYSGLVGVHAGISFASGCGYFISKDLMQLLIANKDKLEYSRLDDVCFSKFLTAQGVKIIPSKRFDVSSIEHLNSLKFEDIKDYFHFRCKQEDDRNKDVIIMKKIHQLLGGV